MIYFAKKQITSVGDVIMGLDSGSIAVILPNDYRFNRLPNDDIITLGNGKLY